MDSKENKKITVLIDMDSIMVQMIDTWLDKYYEATGERITIDDVDDWDLTHLVSDRETLDNILYEDGFYFDLEPMPGVVKYFTKLMEDGYDLVVVTQAPRSSDFAVKDKKNWMRKHFPDFNLENMIFAHRKYMVEGDIFFDDKPDHLLRWKGAHPNKITATIRYLYNKDAEADWSFEDKETAWAQFYNQIKAHNRK